MYFCLFFFLRGLFQSHVAKINFMPNAHHKPWRELITYNRHDQTRWKYIFYV